MPEASPAAAVRSFWSGTLTFGLVSIPVDFYAAARPRQKSMKMVDAQGHPLGRLYVHGEDGKPLSKDEIMRGWETEDGQVVVITDEEFESAAPEVSRDIDLSRFVPLEQIPPAYFVRPYFLAPGGRSAKAYTLLAQTMEASGKVGIGRFVMRGHEYLVAIIAEGGLLRAETLRTFDELRTAQDVGLPGPVQPPKPLVKQFAGAIQDLLQDELALEELEDRQAERLHALAQEKLKAREDVIDIGDAQDEEEDEAPAGAQIVDLVQLLRKSLGSAGSGGAAGDRSRKPARPTARTGKAVPGSKVTALEARAPAKKTAKPRPAASRRKAATSDLARKTREELYAMATERDIAGRSGMKKDDLIAALQAR